MNHVNSYIQYCNIVGDNGGILMSQKQYQQYKLKHQENLKNRLYTVWMNDKNQQCKNIASSSKCFCDHFYKNHDFMPQSGTKIKCKTAGCKCADYCYLPIYGSQDFKCTCKHSYQNHDGAKKNCKNCPCKAFSSNWACSCGMPYNQHKTISSKTQKQKNNMQSVHPTQGKVTSYSAILDMADRHEETIKNQVKKQGLKVVIEDFVISKPVLKQQSSTWELYNTPISWLK